MVESAMDPIDRYRDRIPESKISRVLVKQRGKVTRKRHVLNSVQESLLILVFRTKRASFLAFGSPLTWSVVIDTSFDLYFAKLPNIFEGLGIVAMSVQKLPVKTYIASARKERKDMVYFQQVFCLEP